MYHWYLLSWNACLIADYVQWMELRVLITSTECNPSEPYGACWRTAWGWFFCKVQLHKSLLIIKLFLKAKCPEENFWNAIWSLFTVKFPLTHVVSSWMAQSACRGQNKAKMISQKHQGIQSWQRVKCSRAMQGHSAADGCSRTAGSDSSSEPFGHCWSRHGCAGRGSGVLGL